MSKMTLVLLIVCAVFGIAVAINPETVFTNALRTDPVTAMYAAKVLFWVAAATCIGGFVLSFFHRHGQQGREFAALGLILGAVCAITALMSIAHNFSHWHQGLAGMMGIILFVFPLLGIVIALPEKAKVAVPTGG
jgi:hypothetical protein